MAEPERPDAKIIPLRPAERTAQPADRTSDQTAGEASVPADWERRAAAGLAFLRRRLTGDYEVDEFGFDP
jgi:hypothetical protein